MYNASMCQKIGANRRDFAETKDVFFDNIWRITRKI